MLKIHPTYRQQGYGTFFLTLLCQLADQTNKTIRLVPTSEFGSHLPRLIQFYERFGFQKVDYEMVRKPQFYLK